MENGTDIATATTSQDQQRITRSAGIVSIAVMASRLLGLVREKVIAYYFAAGVGGDAFYAAFRIPNLMRDLFGEGALSKAFVTTFTATELEDGEEVGLASGEPGFQREFPPTNADNDLIGIFAAPAIVDLIFTGKGFQDVPLDPVGTLRFRFQTRSDRLSDADHVSVPDTGFAGGGDDGASQQQGQVWGARLCVLFF